VEGVNDHGEEERAHEHSGIKISEIEGWMKSTTFPRWVSYCQDRI
jgi:hypothetical protein